MKNIVINDTNIFIDLIELEILPDFFNLPWRVLTTDFVLEELEACQKENVLNYCKSDKLEVTSMMEDELTTISEIYLSTNRQVSFTDCSVWYIAKKNGYILLTGDKKLRTKAQYDNIEVHGILFIFDKLVEHEILSTSHAADLLAQLQQMSHRYLPKEDIEQRILKWRMPMSIEFTP